MIGRKFRQTLREYFSFSRSERNGIVVLLFLIILVIIVKAGLPYYLDKRNIKEFKGYQATFDLFDSIQLKKQPPRSDSIVGKKPAHRTFSRKYPRRKSVIPVVELNHADSADLEKLPGIGTVLSKRIIKYRNLLGGFYCVGQIQEVYGIKPETYAVILPYLFADTSYILKIPVNTASFREINAHPYISFDQTRKIMNLRRKSRITPGLLLQEKIFSEEELKKILIYFDF